MLSQLIDLYFCRQAKQVVFLYRIFIRAYIFAILIAANWNKKAREWRRGRKNLFRDLEKKTGSDKIIWMHCASAGELEQGKPLIEELTKQFPSHKILISFFSPSGYAAAVKYNKADIITYLPADTKTNARRFVQLIKPELVIFVKYEYWYEHLSQIALRNIPILLVSAIFRKGQPFFKPYGKFFRQILSLFRQIFVQDEESLTLLRSLHIQQGVISGDTRFDRVTEIAARFTPLPIIEHFVAEKQVIVAGSTWNEDEEHLSEALKNFPGFKIILAPHEINENHIRSIEKLFPNSLRYSKVELLFGKTGSAAISLWEAIEKEHKETVQQKLADAKVLIIDNMGMLSRLYNYATITCVGGGFNKSGIHNTLEAAVYGKPVFFGPHYQKFREARGLIACGAAFSYERTTELTTKLQDLISGEDKLKWSSEAAKNYVEENRGATRKILQYIQENRLLTN
ncbi:MAG: 3-deoxy-D-manno-octulosonic acid transferase [Flavisolibacter sp.]